MNIAIKREQTQDYSEVYTLVEQAFLTAEHSDGTEQNLVERLRKSDAFIPELSLVAMDGERIVGHIMFTRIDLGDILAVTLAPLAVHPDYQKKGIGTLLIEEGHRVAKNLGYEFSVLVGHETYYPRFGYRRASEFGITSPLEVPDINFMALNLLGHEMKVNKTIQYPKEFF